MAIDVKKLERDEGKKPEKEPVKLTSEQEKILAQKKTLEEERTYRQGTVTVRDLIAPASFQVNPDFLKIGDKFIRTMFIVTYPRYVNIGWGAPIINYNGTLDIGMFFYPIPSEVILKQLKELDIEIKLPQRDK